jgi:putative two-component system response regulator
MQDTKIPIDYELSHILIVDDDEILRETLQYICNKLGYTTTTASDGIYGLSSLKNKIPDVVLLDYVMPEMSGIEFLNELKKEEAYSYIPVIMLTGDSSKESRINGIAAGAIEFLTKPVDPDELSLRLKNVIRMKKYQDLLLDKKLFLDSLIKERTKELQRAIDEIHFSHQKLREAYSDTIYRLALTAEFRDHDNAAHIKRIGEMAKILAGYLGYSEDFQDDIYYSSILHDVGKIGIPDIVLFKEGKLDNEEWAKMKEHTTLGEKILLKSKSPYITMGEKIAHYHHEHWDGTGYPENLKGEDIPIEARITCIVDQYDALRSVRCYKEGFSHEKALQIISVGDGRTIPEHFDPRVLRCFMDNHLKFQEIFEHMQDISEIDI